MQQTELKEFFSIVLFQDSEDSQALNVISLTDVNHLITQVIKRYSISADTQVQISGQAWGGEWYQILSYDDTHLSSGSKFPPSLLFLHLSQRTGLSLMLKYQKIVLVNSSLLVSFLRVLRHCLFEKRRM